MERIGEDVWKGFKRKGSVSCFKLGGGHIVLYILYISTEMLLSTQYSIKATIK